MQCMLPFVLLFYIFAILHFILFIITYDGRYCDHTSLLVGSCVCLLRLL